MLVEQVVLLVFCGATLAGTVSVLARMTRNAEVRHDLQCRIYLARQISKIAAVTGSVLSSGLAVVLGMAVIESGLFAGWGLFALALIPLLYLAYYVNIARMPFTYPDDL